MYFFACNIIVIFHSPPYILNTPTAPSHPQVDLYILIVYKCLAPDIYHFEEFFFKNRKKIFPDIPSRGPVNL